MPFFLKRIRFCISGLVLLALILGGAVPAGFMPKFGRGLSIEICTASGLLSIMVPADKSPLKQVDGRHDRCPYAPVLAHHFTPVSFTAAFITVFAAMAERARVYVPVGAVFKPWNAQGPPSSFTARLN